MLPPIPTKGLTVEDVDELLQMTQAQMLATLREISIPSRKGVEAAAVDEIVEEKIRPEALFDSAPESILEPKGVMSPTSTEDEMEGDAVLLKLPDATPGVAQ